MARAPRDVTEAELAILQLLWENGPLSVRELVEHLDRQATASQVATVQKLLFRLEEKECIQRDRTGPVQRFSAMVDREELIGRRLQGIAEELCAGSLTPLLTHLVSKNRLSKRELRELRELIDRLDGGSP